METQQLTNVEFFDLVKNAKNGDYDTEEEPYEWNDF